MLHLLSRGPVFSNKTKWGLNMPKVLISDKMDPLAAEIFQNNGIAVDVKPGLKPEELKAIIGNYAGLAVRSSTIATPEIIGAVRNL